VLSSRRALPQQRVRAVIGGSGLARALKGFTVPDEGPGPAGRPLAARTPREWTAMHAAGLALAWLAGSGAGPLAGACQLRADLLRRRAQCWPFCVLAARPGLLLAACSCWLVLLRVTVGETKAAGGRCCHAMPCYANANAMQPRLSCLRANIDRRRQKATPRPTRTEPPSARKGASLSARPTATLSSTG